jgi:uncharacterized protein YdhG (YjbR/CyaY superfamily)
LARSDGAGFACRWIPEVPWNPTVWEKRPNAVAANIRDSKAGIALHQIPRQDLAMAKQTAKSIDEYVERFPEAVRERLEHMRATIKRAAPKAEEAISYGIPAFRLNGLLVWFAAFKGHIGFYPRKSAIIAFKEELSVYKGAKGSVQFPFDEPLPLGLVSRMVKFRVAENMASKKKRS